MSYAASGLWGPRAGVVRAPVSPQMMIRRSAQVLITSSGVTIDQVYREIKKIRADMVKREDHEALVDTVEILISPATMQVIKKSDRDIRQGRVKTITSVDDLLNECA